MPNHVVRFPHGTRHGWYLGRDELVGLLPGHEREWRLLWAAYSERSGETLTDLRFADDEEREEFVRDLRL